VSQPSRLLKNYSQSTANFDIRGHARRRSAAESHVQYLSPEARVRKDHPLGAIRVMVDEVLGPLLRRLDAVCGKVRRPSIAPGEVVAGAVAADAVLDPHRPTADGTLPAFHRMTYLGEFQVKPLPMETVFGLRVNLLVACRKEFVTGRCNTSEPFRMLDRYKLSPASRNHNHCRGRSAFD
jgi:hypothetical protein